MNTTPSARGQDAQQPAPDSGQLLAEIDARLVALGTDAALVEALVDSRQRGLGFLTPEGKRIQDDQVRAEKKAHNERLVAGQVVGPGESPAPGNLQGLSVAAELWVTLRHQVRVLTRHLARRGICTLHQLPPDPNSRQLAWHLRLLVWDLEDLDTDNTPVLRQLARDLEHAHDLADRLLEGNPRTELGLCPHCERGLLIVYFRDGIIRCEHDPHTGRREPCTCPDPLCECKARPVAYRHTWHRAKGDAPGGWWKLAGRVKPRPTSRPKP